MGRMNPEILRSLVALVLLAAAPVAAQTPAARDTIEFSLGEAVSLALEQNPRVLQAAARRSGVGAALWSAYGNLLPQLGLTGQLQRTEAGSFAFFGTRFRSPESYATVYQWDITHPLLDAGRDWFRIKAARAEIDRELAAYDDQAWQTTADVETEYLTARRHQARVAQARRELDRRREHERLAEARYQVGAVTRSDVLQARLAVNQGELGVLQAEQDEQEAELALRRLLGGKVPPGPIELTSQFVVFPPAWDTEALIPAAMARHPSLRRIDAQERIDASTLSIARSHYLPSLQAQYSLSRSVVDTTGFDFSGFDDRNYFVLTLSWRLFGGFSRHDETSRAHAALRATRQERNARELEIEETLRSGLARVRTAYAAHQSNALSVELAQEDLRLAEGRYRTGAGSFVDLLDARVRAAQAETDLIASTYDFYLALVALERATGVPLIPEEAMR